MSLVAIKEDWTPADAIHRQAWRNKMYAPKPEPKRDPLAVKIEEVADPEKTLADARLRELEQAIAIVHEQLAQRRREEDDCEPPPSTPTRPKLGQIAATVCRYYGVTLTEFNSNRRQVSIVRSRQVASYLCKELTLRSYPEIGRHIGGRDHTTILHAVRKIAALRLTDAVLCQELVELESLFA